MSQLVLVLGTRNQKKRAELEELLGPFGLLGDKGAFAAGKFLEFDLLAFELFALLLDALQLALGLNQLAFVILWIAFHGLVGGGGHFHLGRTDPDVLGVV